MRGAEALDQGTTSTEPTREHCQCRRMAHAGRVLIAHTHACLVRRRGGRSLEDYYGRPAQRTQ